MQITSMAKNLPAAAASTSSCERHTQRRHIECCVQGANRIQTFSGHLCEQVLARGAHRLQRIAHVWVLALAQGKVVERNRDIARVIFA